MSQFQRSEQNILELSVRRKSVSHRVRQMKERLGSHKTIQDTTKLDLLGVGQMFIYNDRNVTSLAVIKPLPVCKETSNRIQFVLL